MRPVFTLIVLLGGCSGQVVNSSFGPILGKIAHGVKDGLLNVTCNQFTGIPYAKPPTGALRFERPQAWETAYPAPGFDASNVGDSCPQLVGAIGNEDCLKLNVFTPPGTIPGENLPMLVFVHGGSFVIGSGSSPMPPIPAHVADLYDGCVLADKYRVIVATMNYRLGPFGFLVTQDSDGRVEGNYGIDDQRAALQWLRKEASAFGGTTEGLTLFGQSAGAISVMHHLVSPRSAGLFDRAISQSGMPLALSAEFGYHLSLDFASKLRCQDTPIKECLRSKTPEQLLAKSGEMGNPFASNGFGPVITFDEDLPAHPTELFDKQKYHQVDVMLGHTTDEATLFVYPTHPLGIHGKAAYSKFVLQGLNGHDPALTLNQSQLELVFKAYPGRPVVDNREMASALVTDYTFLCGSHQVANAMGSAFFYRFDYRSECLDAFKAVIPGVFHTAELPYVFQTPHTEFCKFTAAETKLAEQMGTLWTTFAKTGKPTADAREWPVWLKGDGTHGTRQSAVFRKDFSGEIGLETEVGYKQEVCEMWRVLEQSMIPHT